MGNSLPTNFLYANCIYGTDTTAIERNRSLCTNTMFRFQGTNGETPLEIACDSYQSAKALLLLDILVDINTKRGHANTSKIQKIINHQSGDSKSTISSPLLNAMRKGHQDVANKLLLLGCNPNPTRFHMTDPTPLLVALQESIINTSMVKSLINLKADVNAKEGCDGITPLMLISQKKFYDNSYIIDIVLPIIETMIKNGCDINARSDAGRTALMLACDYQNDLVASKLIELGADVNIVDTITNSNALMLLCAFRHAQLELKDGILENFIEKTQDLDTVRKISKDTALHLACKSDLADVACMLIEKGANVDLPNAWGETPYQLAKDHKLTKVMDAIMAKKRKCMDPLVAELMEKVEKLTKELSQTELVVVL